MPEQVPSSLHTETISSLLPVKTVSFPILASNFPCDAIKSSTSSLVAPATSTMTKLFPERSDAFLIGTSDRPYALRRFSITCINVVNSASVNFSSGSRITLVPPSRSRPFLMFELTILSIDIPKCSEFFTMM